MLLLISYTTETFLSQICQDFSKFLRSVGPGIECVVKLRCKEVIICAMEG